MVFLGIPEHPLRFVRLWHVAEEGAWITRGWIIGSANGELGYATDEFMEGSDRDFLELLQSGVKVIRVPDNQYPIYQVALADEIPATAFENLDSIPDLTLHTETIKIRKARIHGFIVRVGFGKQTKTWVASGSPVLERSYA